MVPAVPTGTQPRLPVTRGLVVGITAIRQLGDSDHRQLPLRPSILQAEFSLSQVLDRPLASRVLFEEVIRENLDIGRPDRVSLIFDRRIHRSAPRAARGRYRTRVLTDGVVRSPHVECKSTRVKQYLRPRIVFVLVDTLTRLVVQKLLEPEGPYLDGRGRY